MSVANSDRLPACGVIFSMNRAMQLDATLRSFLLHCQDAGQVELVVLWKATTEQHASQYAQLTAEFSRLPQMHFEQESNFRLNLLVWLAEQAGLSPENLYRYVNTLRLGRLASPLAGRFLRISQPRYVLFLVDDNIFVHSFHLADVLNSLLANPGALGFSLRLGSNTTHCYTVDQRQALPAFSSVAPGILKYDWTRSELDFHYPLEVSSSVYRLDEILPLLHSLHFRNPNQLESRMAARWQDFVTTHPDLLCFQRSVTFCNPVNRVQQVEQNRAGVEFSCTADELAAKFAAGLRVDVNSYDGFVPKGCHQEVALQFRTVE